MPDRTTPDRTASDHRARARRTGVPHALLPALVLASLAAGCADPSAPRATPPSDGPLAARAGTDGDGREAPLSAVDQPAGTVIPGDYIVVYRDDVTDVDATLRGQARALAARGGALDEKRVARRFRHTLKGFAGTLDARTVAMLRADPAVAYVEPDQIVTVSATQTGATWGIDRIDQRALPLSGSYTWTAAGAGVRVYIIDTGLLSAHREFSGRASNVYDGFGGNGQDCNGHGTHVGGTVGGETYGVAKDALLRGVRVFQCSGSSANSTIIGGIDWVAANHIKPAVANLSLGGGRSQATNDAVTRLANAGVFVAVAAGNENQDACNVSPASAPGVTTVASSTRTDAKSSFSNWGSCVDLYAPGSSITAAWWTSTTAVNTISGTSMASPHVAGVAALYKAARGDASQGTIDSWLKTNATGSVITGNVSGTPNRLLFKSTL